MARSRLPAYALAVALLVTSGGVAGSPASAAEGCLSSGTEANINAALSGPGAVVVLCRGAEFWLNGSIHFNAPNQRLTTEGQPTDGSRALLRLAHGSLTNAISAENVSGVVIEHIRVDGMGLEFGNRQGRALVHIGGNATDQRVQHIVARNTRGWPVLQLFEGAINNRVPACQRATVVNNEIGPTKADNGFGSDGIMLACGNSLVKDNLVRNATDVGIVIFGAPGSLIQGNTVVAETEELPNGIAMADFVPMGGNYAGTRVDGNTIDARGNFIRVAMPIGPRVYGWCDNSMVAMGGSVTNNTLRGQFMGYGIAVSSVLNFNISGNVDLSRHVGRVSPGCGGVQPQPTQVSGFIYHPSFTGGTALQPGFQAANVADLVLHSSLPPILLLPPHPPAGCGQLTRDEWLAPAQSLFSCDGRHELAMQADGNLVLYLSGRARWSSNTFRHATAMAVMQGDGNFVTYNTGGFPNFSTGTVTPGSRLALQNDGNLVVYDPANRPLWASNTRCC